MPISAEFEERTYEKYFGYELQLKPKQTFSPGQCAEFYLGFDEAFSVPLRRFWWMFPKLLTRWWHPLPGISLDEVEDFFTQLSDALPPFRFNLFAQFKRPEYVMGHMGTEWRHWSSPYYRYKIVKHQHEALERIHKTASGRAACVYASAAFIQNRDLYSFAETGKVISESNIASIAEVGPSHTSFTYQKPGEFGIACSEPEEVSSPNLDEIILVGLEQPAIPWSDHIVKTASIIRSSISEYEDGRIVFDAARRTILGTRNVGAAENHPESISYSIATVEAFSEVFGTTLFSFV